MAKWGESVLGGDGGDGSSTDMDADLLSRMYIFRNTVKCPGQYPNIFIFPLLYHSPVSKVAKTAYRRYQAAFTLHVARLITVAVTGEAKAAAWTSVKSVKALCRRVDAHIRGATGQRRLQS